MQSGSSPVYFEYDYPMSREIPRQSALPEVEPLVLDDNTTVYPFSLGRACSNMPPRPVSTLGTVRILFVSEEGSSDRGWVAEYRTTGSFVLTK